MLIFYFFSRDKIVTDVYKFKLLINQLTLQAGFFYVQIYYNQKITKQLL